MGGRKREACGESAGHCDIRALYFQTPQTGFRLSSRLLGQKRPRLKIDVRFSEQQRRKCESVSRSAARKEKYFLFVCLFVVSVPQTTVFVFYFATSSFFSLQQIRPAVPKAS